RGFDAGDAAHHPGLARDIERVFPQDHLRRRNRLGKYVDDDNAPALFGEQGRGRGPDAAASAGHKDDVRVHGLSLFGGTCHVAVHRAVSSSARNTRLSTLPDGFRGRLSRMTSSLGTLKPASRDRQWLTSEARSSVEFSVSTTTATGFSPQRSSGMPTTATSRTADSS